MNFGGVTVVGVLLLDVTLQVVLAHVLFAAVLAINEFRAVSDWAFLLRMSSVHMTLKVASPGKDLAWTILASEPCRPGVG